MRRLAPPGTLAGLLFGHGASGDDWQKTVLAETAAAAAVLKSWLSVPSGHSPGEAARSLLGLGQGLTPTGDDILAGTLVTLRALGRDREAGELADAVEAYGAGATNRISLAHLRAAAAGQGALPFHDVLVELLRGEENFEPCLGRIGAVGHSSGWDILTGIATTVESLEMLKKS